MHNTKPLLLGGEGWRRGTAKLEELLEAVNSFAEAVDPFVEAHHLLFEVACPSRSMPRRWNPWWDFAWPPARLAGRGSILVRARVCSRLGGGLGRLWSEEVRITHCAQCAADQREGHDEQIGHRRGLAGLWLRLGPLIAAVIAGFFDGGKSPDSRDSGSGGLFGLPRLETGVTLVQWLDIRHDRRSRGQGNRLVAAVSTPRARVASDFSHVHYE